MARSSESLPPVVAEPRATSPVDIVEQALAQALARAASVGRFDVVLSLAAELEARRKARAGVVGLDAERVRRGKPGP